MKALFASLSSQWECNFIRSLLADVIGAFGFAMFHVSSLITPAAISIRSIPIQKIYYKYMLKIDTNI